jgi:hypothetical protein
MGESTLRFRGIALLGAICLAVAAPATVTAETLLSVSTMVAGTNAEVYSFDAPSAGTLNVQLTDLGWPSRLASLNSTIYSSSTALGSLSAAGDLSIQLSGPIDLSAFVSAQAQGALDLGLYSLDVTFSPSASPVPLPPAGLLLTGGMGLLATLGWRWRRREGEPPRARHESVMCDV